MAKRKVKIRKTGLAEILKLEKKLPTKYKHLTKKDAAFLKARRRLAEERKEYELLDREKYREATGDSLAKIREAKKLSIEKRFLKEEQIKAALEKVKTGRVSPTIRKADEKFSAGVRKLIHVLAPKGGIVKAATVPSKKGTGRGRGRPTGTFKTRVLPSGRVVKVHTNVYKKLLAQEKAQMRLERVQRQFQAQQVAEQIAMQQDPRFQAGAEEQFLAEQDPMHEANVARAQQEAEMAQFQQQQRAPRQPSRVRNILSNISNLGGGRRPQPQVIGYDEFGRPIMQQVQQPIQIPQIQRPQPQEMRPRLPQRSMLSDTSSILDAPNIFNNPGESNLA